MMAQEDLKKLGIVSEVGLERDATEFTVYNLKVGIKLKAEKKLSYTEGEKLIKQLRKELLGKNIELEAVAVPCPMCGKVFNSEAGMKQHVRRQHNGAEAQAKKNRGRPKKAAPKKTPEKRKKRASSKKK
jgi:hypothetical protein